MAGTKSNPRAGRASGPVPLEHHRCDLSAFTGAGFGTDQVLEVIAGLAVSVMANYAGNITDPAVEDPFKPHAWKP